MRILIVGMWKWPQYEAGFARGLEYNGCIVERLTVRPFSINLRGKSLVLPFLELGLSIVNHKKVLRKVKDVRPSIVLFWRPTSILPKTVRYVNELDIITVSYNNDDPFNALIKDKFRFRLNEWFLYHRTLECYRFNFFYRTINCIEAVKFGVKHAEVLLPYYLPERDKNVVLSEDDLTIFKTQVVFVGHYESDHRVKCINRLVREGIQVKIWSGEDWKKKNLGDTYSYFAPIIPANNENYAKALCGADICLVFLSKENRDTYTRRCFEIPACGKLMLAERTSDLLELFEENKEACYFSDEEELLLKVKWLLSNPDILEKIAEGGFNKVTTSGHSVDERAKLFLDSITL
jgi:spore maturation protein CgeB